MAEDPRAEASVRNPLIRLRGVRKVYQEGDQERVVLDGLNLTIRRGEMVVLMGRSGSGKSTLLNLISGIDRPTAGEVVMGGRHLTRLSEDERTRFRRRHIGFVFQSFNLISTLTAEENLRLPLDLQEESDADEHHRSRELLAAVGLEGRGDSFPDRLSGGEQQRVAIARALAHEPLLVLADEPTGNLDYETGQHVMGLIDRLVRQRGQTLLIATHDRDLLGRADRILTLQSGRLEEKSAEEAVSV